MRPYLLFVSGIAGLTGMAAGFHNNFNLLVFILAFIPFFLGYGFGQSLTDCFQVDTDSISAPYRPLVKGEISILSLGIVSITGLIVISFCIIYLNPYNILWCFLTILGLATYTYFKKNFWFAGPFYNGWIVMLLPVMGFMCTCQENYSSLFFPEMKWICLLTLFSYGNFVLIGYLKDISADKLTNYKTFPVVFGWNKTVWAGDLFVIISCAACFNLIGTDGTRSLVIYIMGSLVAISGQLTAHFVKNKTEKYSGYPILSTVRAFILWHMSVIDHFQPNWFLFLICFYLVFEAILYFRPAKLQI